MATDTLWGKIQDSLVSNGHLTFQRASGLPRAAENKNIVPALRREDLSDVAIGQALKDSIGSPVFDRERYTDDEFACAERGYEGDSAWLQIGDEYYASNPLCPLIYSRFGKRFKPGSFGKIGYLSFEYSHESEFKGVSKLDEKEDALGSETSYDSLIDKIIEAGIAANANDIHISQNNQSELEVFFQIDKQKRPYSSFKNVDIESFSNMLWARCNTVARHALQPQDGQFEIEHEGQMVQLRVSRFRRTTAKGKSDKYDLRILKPDRNLRTLDQFGLPADDYNLFQDAFSSKDGLILVTGPVGEGKSSIIHAGIRMARESDPYKNWMSVEDPVERFIEGVYQASFDKTHMNYQVMLETFLRQSPDAIFVGEIRSNDVAEMAVQAAATGTLLVSTMHNNTAHAAFGRLIDLGQERMQLAERLRLITSQRLLQKLCDHCKIETTLDEETEYNRARYEQMLSDISGGNQRIFKHNTQGCSQCFAGYSGRVIVVEMLRNTADMQEYLLSGASMLMFRRDSIAKNKFIDLNYRGIEKLAEGVVDVNSLRVLPEQFVDRPELEAKLKRGKGMRRI